MDETDALCPDFWKEMVEVFALNANVLQNEDFGRHQQQRSSDPHPEELGENLNNTILNFI
jgi:hypothetical protein